MNAAIDFWTGQGGDEYVTRNEGLNVGQRVAMWRRVFDNVVYPYSVLEVGANIGVNLQALKQILPPLVKYYAVEPNIKAYGMLTEHADVTCLGTADHLPLEDRSIDVVFTSGVLIHIEPEKLLRSCQEIHRVARQYVICAEYFADKPEHVDYRGSHIWKRDFGQFWLDNFEDLRPIDCGFEWRGLTGMDNITWWVFEKCP